MGEEHVTTRYRSRDAAGSVRQEGDVAEVRCGRGKIWQRCGRKNMAEEDTEDEDGTKEKCDREMWQRKDVTKRCGRGRITNQSPVRRVCCHGVAGVTGRSVALIRNRKRYIERDALQTDRHRDSKR